MADTWEEYFKEYPARQIEAEPVSPLYRCKDRVDAERYYENFQEAHDIGGIEVVRFGDEFFVVYKDE